MKTITFLLTILNSVILILSLKKINSIMAKQDQINASLAELNDATNEIAADLQALRDQVASGDPVSAESLAALDAAVQRLKAMGTDPDSPIDVVQKPK